MSNLNFSAEKPCTTDLPTTVVAPVTVATNGVPFAKSNRVIGIVLEHSAGAHGAAVCTLWGYSIKKSKWYRLKKVNVDTDDNPSYYNVDIYALGWDRLYVQIDGLGTISDLTYKIAHECHMAGGQ
jgi:hypothetical protein